jgi:PBSX family phage terminase large subunit
LDLDLNLSTQQAKYLKSTSDITIASGSIRSGKSYVQILTFILYLRSPQCLEKEDMLFVGKTGGSLERNIVKDLMNWVEKLGISHEFHYVKAPDKKLTFIPKNINIHFVGGNDEGSESKIRGMTSQALFVDEITLLPRSFIDQCFGRMSAGEQKAWITTNPDSPAHWFYSGYMQNPDLDVNLFYFTLVDNPSLDYKYKKKISAIYKGADYDRFILGKWVADKESMVIPEFIENEEDIVKELDRPKYCNKLVAMDVGFRDYTFLVFGYYDFEKAAAVVEDEIVLRAPLTEELANLIRKKEKDVWGFEYIGNYEYKDDEKPYCRYSDTDLLLINDLSVTYQINFAPTGKDNKDVQINKLRRWVDNGRLFIHPRCEKLISHLRTAVWNKSKTSYERSEDQGHFDGVDALLYFVRNIPEHNNPFPATFYTENNKYVSQDYLEGDRDDNLEVLSQALNL